MRHRERFDYDVYLSYYDKYQFFQRGKIVGREPTWSEKGLIYDYADINDKHFNVTIPVNENLRKNKTLYLHMQVKARNPLYIKGINDKDYGQVAQIENELD